MSAGGYYSNVAPRYLEPRKPVPAPALPPKEKIPINPQYAQVTPRYLSPKRAPVAGSSTDKKSATAKAKGHQSIPKEILFVNKKLLHVQPRFLDPANYMPSNDSPRRQVERKHVNDRREHDWRSDTVIGSCKFFDDYVPMTEERAKRAPSPKKTFKDTPSMVAAYIKDDIPIRHVSMAEQIQKKKLEESRGQQSGDDTGRGRSPSRGNQHASRDNSRNNSPCRHWSNAGWQNMTFSDREQQTLASQPRYQLEVKHVIKNVEERARASVSTEHIPRVATLSPGFRLQALLRVDRQLATPTSQAQHHSGNEDSAGKDDEADISSVLNDGDE